MYEPFFRDMYHLFILVQDLPMMVRMYPRVGLLEGGGFLTAKMNLFLIVVKCDRSLRACVDLKVILDSCHVCKCVIRSLRACVDLKLNRTRNMILS